MCFPIGEIEKLNFELKQKTIVIYGAGQGAKKFRRYRIKSCLL